MNKKDKEEVTQIVTDALNDVMIPALEDMEERITKKLDDKADKSDIDRLERKLDGQQDRLDRHDKRIQALESPASS